VRDLAIVAIVCGSLPLILFRPYFGLMVYCWLAYMRPQDMAWGMSRTLPLSQWVAIAMVVGIALALGRERLATMKPQTVLMILLGLWISLTVITAVQPEASQVVYGHYWKGILIAVLTTGLVRERNRFRWLLLLVIFSLGFLGAKRGLYGLLRGGIRYNDGPGGFIADNNSFALVLNMMLPLLVGVAISDQDRRVRIAAAVTAGLCVPTILFTFSRGGLLTLCLVSVLLVWRSRRRWLVAAVMGLAFLGVVAFSSDQLAEQYKQRAESIGDYQEDRSALGRLNAWQTSWNVFLDYPLLGVGPDNLVVVFARYAPDPDNFHVAHNAYFQVLAECGLPALLFFVGSLGAAFWQMQRLRRETAAPEVEMMARMFQITLLAYMTGSLFLNTAYNELIYELIALTVCLEVVSRQPAEGAARAPVAITAGELPWWKRAPAPAPSTPSWTGRA
jgi:probable O-glycosylation ligase (exosortase A-associated)